MKNKFRIGRLSNILAVFLIVALLSLTVPPGGVQAATRFALAKTIISPTATVGGFFGEAVAVVGDKFLIGARGECAPACGGAVHLFDSDGNPVRTILTPTLFASFGFSVGGVGENPLVGAIHDSTAGSNAGAAYLFDDATGDLLRTFLNPNPAQSGSLDFFGWAVAGFGNNVLVSAPAEDDFGAQDAGVVYLFNGASGQLILTIQNPTPAIGESFGSAITTVGNNIAIAAAFDGTAAPNGGAVYLFNGNGDLIKTLVSPRPPLQFGGFGSALAAFGDDLLVAEQRGFTGDIQAGVVHLFDGTTGDLIRSYFNPTPVGFELFGNSVAASGNNVLVGALRNERGPVAGAAYLFDGTTGALTATFLNPDRSVQDSFAQQVAAIGNSVLISSPSHTSDPATTSEDGAAYLFQPRR